MNTQPFQILFEDDHFLAIDKPSGITVNNSDTTRNQQTVQDWSQSYLRISTDEHASGDPYENEFYKRGGIVHRLDKETSGILLIAKTPEAFLKLQEQFKERLITKKYLALAHDKISPETGEIVLPVGRLPWNRKQFGIVAGGRPAETKYETIGVYKKDNEIFSYVRLFPKTGRTHQIRVHLKYLHHPIFSDFLYAGRKTSRRDREFLPRVFLHASEITFSHPISGDPLTILSPLPGDLQAFLDTCIEVLS